jgi:hypothetical protein
MFWVGTFFEPQIYSDTFSHYTIFYNLDSGNIFRIQLHAHPQFYMSGQLKNISP